MAGELLVLRLLHVIGAILWVGGMSFSTFFVMPAVAQAGPAAGPVMAGFQRRKVFVWMPVIAIVTILSGFRLLMIVSSNFGSTYLSTPTGRTFTISAVIGLLAFLIGMIVTRPAMTRMGMLSAEAANATEARRAEIQAELATIRARNARITLLVTILLLIAAAGMAVARYMR
jgi:uncharacterized membrane protein